MSYRPCTKAASNVRLAAPSIRNHTRQLYPLIVSSPFVRQQASAHGPTQDGQERINHRPHAARFVTQGNNSLQLLFGIRAEYVAEAQHDVLRVTRGDWRKSI